MCSGTGRWATDPGHPIWSQMLFGTKSELVTFPLCEGTGPAAKADEDILWKDPWRAFRLAKSAQDARKVIRIPRTRHDFASSVLSDGPERRPRLRASRVVQP